MVRETVAMNRSLQFCLRLALALIFGFAAIGKIADPATFAFAIDNYRLTPWPIAAGLALYLPWLELVAGIAMFWPRCSAGGAAILTGLSGIFVTALTSALMRGLDISCGCFGSDTGSGLVWPLIRAAALFSVGCWLLWAEQFPCMGSKGRRSSLVVIAGRRASTSFK